MAQAASRSRPGREFFRTYTQDLTSEGLQRLFTRDARDAYRFFARELDQRSLASLPWHKRVPAALRLLFLAFTLKLSPARRALYAVALLAVMLGLLEAFMGIRAGHVPIVGIPFPVVMWRSGAIPLLIGFVLLNLLVFMEVADRLSLKDELEVAREIQNAMLRNDTFRAAGVEAFGQTRPANTVGGDFYEVLPLDDGRLVVALGDVAGKGSPAALLMALLLAILRTLLDEGLDPPTLVTRLNYQIARHAPASRFITLFFAVYDPASGQLTYVNAGQNPPLLRRVDGSVERLPSTGVALGLSRRTACNSAVTSLGVGDLLVLYSDGVTEAENPGGVAFDESGLEHVMQARRDATAPDVCGAILDAVARHADDTRFADDLTVVALRRLPPVPTIAG